ncbi:hypothetical protein [Candidatus Nitrosocosmicus sp. SS]|uniref:hypothetical protein n=1 Tax=Candidatus Nitrosocosmicus agrestis TaxID=2563600 RepID=UPI00122E52DD|nr:hypothetical protein [Candidatus Nitrosocosmicus sp. SS]KAA2283098.1 hypothetical protein F1Z66_03190 [Candidatus Nitrosocosmicus sp. SS]KAF0868554.1 hypothetical protein E5N71_09220 [Candidatus Nitrosocosmicus sp. SS]
MTIEANLDFILSHFDANDLFPRKMMTNKSNGQFIVKTKREILSRCKESDYIDCRINAYHFFQTANNKSYTQFLPSPNFVFIDLDLSSFDNFTKPREMLDIALNKVLEKIYLISQTYSQQSQHSLIQKRISKNEEDLMQLKVEPTVLWTGNGYHVYLPIQSLLLDQYELFSKEKYPNLFTDYSKYSRFSVSELFLQYGENFFTNGKADPNHKPTFRSCLIRIPDTFNSKCLQRGYDHENSKVKIIKKWNGQRLPIQLLTKGFRRWLMQLEVDQYKFSSKYANNLDSIKTTNHICLQNHHTNLIHINRKIWWIEKLLSTPILDHRKFCLWRIFLPYLLNIRKLTVDETVLMLKEWLDKCDLTNELDFNSVQKIHEYIRYVGTYLPPSKYRLRSINTEVYEMVKRL